ncbi:MAG: class I SAM-dependent methyltransferase, partial [bacterium]
MVRQASGVLDDNVSPGDQLSAGVSYDTPKTRGGGVCDLVDGLSGKRVLDLGCGRAPDRSRLEAKGAEWVGLDLTGPECSVIGDGDHLPFRDAAFGAVLCAAVLEHMPDPDTIMTEVKRVLAPGGK